MTITKLMQKYVVYVHDSRDAIRLQQFIEAREPTFWFSGYKTNTSVGYYWCNQDNGHLCFTPRYEVFIPQRPIVLVKELIAEYNKANEISNNLLNDAIKKIQLADSEEHPLSQIHISFDGMTTHCIAKNKKGVVARSKAQPVGSDKENYDQIVGAIISLVKLMPEEKQIDLLDRVLEAMEIGVDIDIDPIVKLVKIGEE